MHTTFDELMIKLLLREAAGSEAFLMSFCPLSKAPLNVQQLQSKDDNVRWKALEQKLLT